MRLPQKKMELFHHIKRSQLTGNMSHHTLNIMQERVAERLLELFDRAQFPVASLAAQGAAYDAEKHIKELAILGIKPAMDFYKGILDCLSFFSEKMKIQLKCSLKEIGEKTEDPEFLFSHYEDMKYEEAIERLSLAAKKEGHFATKAAFQCIKLTANEFLLQGKLLSPKQEEQFNYWANLLFENIYELSTLELFSFKRLLFLQNKRGTETLDEFAEVLIQDCQTQANNGNPSALFFLALHEWGDENRRINLFSQLHTMIAGCSDVAPRLAAAVARHLAKLKKEDALLLKEAAALGCSESACALGFMALKQTNQDAEALNYFNLALAQSTKPSSLRKNICTALCKNKKLDVVINLHYYFKLCADYFNDYKCLFVVRNTEMYKLVNQGLRKLQMLHPENVALMQLQNKWHELSKQSFSHCYNYRHVDSKSEMNEAVSEIISVAESALNVEEQARMQLRL